LALFTYLLVIFSAGYLQMLRTYRRNIAVRASQQNARIVMEELVRDARTSYAAVERSNVTTIGPLQYDALCLFRPSGAIKYGVYQPPGETIQIRRSFFVPNSPNLTTACDNQGPAGPTWERINASDTRMLRFDVGVAGTVNTEQTVTLNLRLGSMLDPAVDLSAANCRSEQTTVCAAADLVSTVTLRGVR
jgi:hypothetical protein